MVASKVGVQWILRRASREADSLVNGDAALFDLES